MKILLATLLALSGSAFAATSKEWRAAAKAKIESLDFSTSNTRLQGETETTAVYTKLFAKSQDNGDLMTCHVAVFVSKADASIVAPADDQAALDLVYAAFSYGDERVDNDEKYVLICAD